MRLLLFACDASSFSGRFGFNLKDFQYQTTCVVQGGRVCGGWVVCGDAFDTVPRGGLEDNSSRIASDTRAGAALA